MRLRSYLYQLFFLISGCAIQVLDAAPITYGSAVRLASSTTNYFLHANGMNYYKELSSNIRESEQVNGVHYAYQFNVWFVRVGLGKDKNADIGKPVLNGDTIRLYNAHFSDQLLHAFALSQGYKAPKDFGGLVTMQAGNGDINSEWIIQAVDKGGKILPKGISIDSEHRFNLIHKNGSNTNIANLKKKEFLRMYPYVYNPFSPEAVTKKPELKYVGEQIVGLDSKPENWRMESYANFNDSYMHIPHAPHTPGHVSFNKNWKFKQAGSGSLIIKARAKNDVFVVISSQVYPAYNFHTPQGPGERYHFLFGGWKNTRTHIQKYFQQGAQIVAQQLNPILFLNDQVRNEHKLPVNQTSIMPNAMITGGMPKDGIDWDSYWIRVENGTITWGKGAAVGDNIIGTYADPAPLKNVLYIGFGGWDQLVELQQITIDGVSLAPVSKKKRTSQVTQQVKKVSKGKKKPAKKGRAGKKKAKSKVKAKKKKKVVKKSKIKK